MNIENYTEAIKACRFCFMCRHLSGIGNVTFRESDTPRVRAILLDRVPGDPTLLANADLLETLYNSDLSAACRYHCVKHFDENGLQLAAREDIVEAGLAPADVRQVAAEYLARPAAPAISGEGEVLYFIDYNTASVPTIATAFGKIMKKAGVSYRIAEKGCPGKALKVLGYAKEAQKSAREFAAAVNTAGVKTIVVSNPAAYDALVHDFPEMGIKLKGKVTHTSEYLLSLKLACRKKAGALYYLESDFLKNYHPDYEFPAVLLSHLGAECLAFGTNNEESYTCGEGALVLPQLRPTLVKQLASYIEARADHPEKDLLVTASPYTRKQLTTHTKLKVITLEELTASLI